MAVALGTILVLAASAPNGTRLPSISTWAPRSPVPEGLVPFNSSESMGLLATADLAAFQQVMQHLQTQKTQSLCGAATAATILNSLRVEAAADPWYTPYPYFTQEAFFSECVSGIISLSTVLFNGMTLEELRSTIECWGVSSRAFFASASTAADFRSAAVGALRAGHGVGINFLRTGIGEVGGGHWSPIAAYAEQADMFLLLDVSRYKYPPVWVQTQDLFAAMDTQDGTSGKSRGWLLVEK